MEDRLKSLWYDALYSLSHAVCSLGFSLRTEGMHHVPATGPALLIANHQSFVDPILVGVAARRRLSYLARKTLFVHSGLTWLMRSLNAVPVDQEGFAREGLQTLITLLKAGKAVVVFPEGERCRNGTMQPLRAGVHLLIKRAPGPIVPVGIAGAYDAWPRHRHYPTPAPLFLPAGKSALAVSIGRPLDGHRYAALPREQVLAELFTEIQKVQLRAERLRRKA